MYSSWFMCKVRSEKEDEKGFIKKLSEVYLIDAVSYTDAETRLSEKVRQIHNNFNIDAISRSKIAEVFQYADSDVWYKSKIVFSIYDEKSGKEKKVTNQMLVTAISVKEAFDRLTDKLSSTVSDYEIQEIALSPVIEVFPYEAILAQNQFDSTNPQHNEG